MEWKMDWGMSGETSLLEGKPGFAMDFNFFVEDNTVVIDEADVREQQGCVPLLSACVALSPGRCSRFEAFACRSFLSSQHVLFTYLFMHN